ncbi:MAG: glutamine-hydrolyzing carbamoyl-phosphate synthase small subunit [Flavobacteriaceae bacterium]|nr:glutamine-hydrolyzing carbamoyl-phosphate synthase small subunit [Flavobacteriaceae bacterium]
MENQKSAIILLEDGAIFKGKSIGINGTAFGEICFNTGMTGYQEIFTDPSYYGQLMIATNAHIGNYGTNEDEIESDKIQISGLICRNFSFNYSRHNANQSLFDFLKKQNLVTITEVDTRALVSYIRDKGVMNAIISTETDIDKLKKELTKAPNMNGLELASKVTTKKTYFIGNENAKYKIAVLDLGIKKNIIRNFIKRDCYVKVFPYNTTFKEMSAFKPDGYFLSNGPGDPEPLIEAQILTKEIIKRNLPLFGICLGHQIIALANGIKTYKMHNGHRGINHPVKNLITGKAEITSQNHGFVVDRKEVEDHNDFEVTHLHLNDNTLAGMQMKNKNCFSVQYHPEANPGPHDSTYLFDEFMKRL